MYSESSTSSSISALFVFSYISPLPTIATSPIFEFPISLLGVSVLNKNSPSIGVIGVVNPDLAFICDILAVISVPLAKTFVTVNKNLFPSEFSTV